LRSRFEGGLVIDVKSPDFDTRLAILKKKADQEGLEASLEVLEAIALKIQQNIRSLEGSLNRIVAYAKLVRAMLTPELISKALKDISDSAPKALPPSSGMIMEAVVNCFQLSPADLKSRKRDEATALARQVAMYIMRQETDFSLAEIGKELGGRSPATVGYAYQKIAQDINNNPALRRKVSDINSKFS
jgi:chromosomal replication initiator protein